MWAPKWRSANSIAPAAVSTGNVIRISRLTTNMFQVKTGMRNIVMPGARIVDTVAMTLTRGDHARHARAGRCPRSRDRRRRRASARRRTAACSRTSRTWRRRPGGQEAAQHHDAGEQRQPVAEGVEPRERHVAGADLQRHEVVGQPEGERADEQQQHDRAVHREELVVDVRAHQRTDRAGPAAPASPRPSRRR